MSNLTTPPSSNGGSGLLDVEGSVDNPGLPGGRITRGIIARWSASSGWTDRDGLPIPTTMLAIELRLVLRRWKKHRPYYITQQPLPNPEILNAAIPQTEWETGLDGKPAEPWKYCYVIYMVDVHKTATVYTYAHDTWGASQAYEILSEQIAVMRMLRGKHVFPMVQLDKRQRKSPTYGLQLRPHLQPTGDWHEPGGLGDAGGSVVPQSPRPQLGGPSTVTPTSTPTSTPSTPTPAPATPSTPTTPPPAAAAAQPSSTILDHMRPVKPVTVGELIADEIPWK